MLSQGTVIRVIDQTGVNAKLLAAAPNILLHNRKMAADMLGFVKALTEKDTPLGPGHFGYHLRNSFTAKVTSNGVKTYGVLTAPMQGFWREFGTKRGERRFQTAHHALAGVRKFIGFYYGGMSNWWHS